MGLLLGRGGCRMARNVQFVLIEMAAVVGWVDDPAYGPVWRGWGVS
jgi:hypothetical protein